MYIREGISARVTEIETNMKEVMWLRVSEKNTAKREACMGLVYNAPNLTMVQPQFR
jgi:hypothetical protein